jgi:hypothetical protein
VVGISVWSYSIAMMILISVLLIVIAHNTAFDPCFLKNRLPAFRKNLGITLQYPFESRRGRGRADRKDSLSAPRPVELSNQ